jgi:hypothetical protein
MNNVTLTLHAIERFQERFAGNLSGNAAAARLLRLLGRAHFLRICPGKGRLYALGEMRFVVQNGALLTVFRPHLTAVPAAEDLWCLS